MILNFHMTIVKYVRKLLYYLSSVKFCEFVVVIPILTIGFYNTMEFDRLYEYLRGVVIPILTIGFYNERSGVKQVPFHELSYPS